MRRPKVSDKHPSIVVDKRTNDAFVRTDVAIWLITELTKNAVKDFDDQRTEYIKAKVCSGDDVDVRFEGEWTAYTVKNLKAMGKAIREGFEKQIEHGISTIPVEEKN